MMRKVPFRSAEQARAFETVVGALTHLGYRSDHVLTQYEYRDYFEPALPDRVAPAVAFAQLPASYETACIAVLLDDASDGALEVRRHRGLGAPMALQVSEDAVKFWKVSAKPTNDDYRFKVRPEQVLKVFEEHRELWSPISMLRAKNIGWDPVSVNPQLDFFDLGLLPALEAHIRERLDPILRLAITEGEKASRRLHKPKSNPDDLFRIAFWCLTAKVLHDREVTGFEDQNLAADPLEALARVARHHGEQTPTARPDVLHAIFRSIWTQLSFRNLTVEVLAFVYENTFVDVSVRKDHGVHATPPSLARYVVNALPFEDELAEQRRVVEPFCGHSAFLVAAMQRLRRLLPDGTDAAARHRYFVRMLEGFDDDPFAVEVSRLCLTLADLPNPDGWRLHTEDVFKSSTYQQSIADARYIVANPPFESTRSSESDTSGGAVGLKPAWLLGSLLAFAHKRAHFGLILPEKFLDGLAYREHRSALVRRFEDIEVLRLPENVFAEAGHPTVALICTHPRATEKNVCRLRSGEVKRSEWSDWQLTHKPNRLDERSISTSDAFTRLYIPRLESVWSETRTLTTVASTSVIHRGLEWTLPFEGNEHRLVSTEARPGFSRGIFSAEEDSFLSLQDPQTLFLNTQRSVIRGSKLEYPWASPKVIVNAVRKSRGPWRMAAVGDRKGLVAYQSFHVIWPGPSWDVDVLAAVIAGPLANAFVETHEPDKHITVTVLGSVPLPRLDLGSMHRIKSMVEQYRRVVRRGLFEDARKLLRAVDAAVLKGYDLSPRVERRLLDHFNDAKRPLPFEFGDYFPTGFTPSVSLAMFESETFSLGTVEKFRALPVIQDAALSEALLEVD